MSVRLRLSLLVAFLVAVSVGGLAAILIAVEHRFLTDQMNAGRRQLLEDFLELCRESALTGEDLSLRNYLRTARRRPDVARLDFIASNGRTIAASQPSGGDLEPAQYDEFRATVSLAGQTLGIARVFFSRKISREIINRQTARAAKRIAGWAAVVLAAGFGLAFAIATRAMKPLNLLAQGVRFLGQGRLESRIPLSGEDEFGLLAREINAMAVKLKELDKMKKDFVSSVSHDLKSPLAAIKPAIEELLEEANRSGSGDSKTEAAESLYLIRDNVERLERLVASILEAAKIESGIILDVSSVNLEDLAEGVTRSFQLLALKKRIGLNLVVDSAIPMIKGDAGKLERVIANLVGNAIKFTESGSVTVKIFDHGASQELHVIDTGCGIPQSAMDKLFTQFYKVGTDNLRRKLADGTGLGLSIVKAIVEAHGGEIRVISEEGRGSTFVVTLPRFPRERKKHEG